MSGQATPIFVGGSGSGIGGSTGSTDNRLLRADGTGAATVQSSAITVDDSGNVSGVGTLGCGVTTTAGDTAGVAIQSWTQSGNPTAEVYSFVDVVSFGTRTLGKRSGLHSDSGSWPNIVSLNSVTAIIGANAYNHVPNTFVALTVLGFAGGQPVLELKDTAGVVITRVAQTGAATFAGAMTLSNLAGNGSGVVAVSNTGVLSWAAAGGAPEGTAVLSTGEVGGTKFLREDGDGTCSWQTISGGGDALVANPLSQFAATTSAQLAGVISDETGTGALVFANTPTLVTPVLGVASATTINKVALTAPATGSTLTIADGATLTVSASATISNGTHSGTNTGDQTNITGNAATVTTNANLTGHVTSVGNAAVLGSFTKAQLDTAVSDGNVLYVGDVTSNANHTGDATGDTALTLATVNSNVGSFGSATASVALTVNAKGLVTAASASTITPAIGSVTGLGTGVATFLATPSSANLIAAVTDETGTGALVFATSPVLVTPALGTPASGTLTNCTAYPGASLTGLIRNSTETTSTPSGTTQTITLGDANHQTLDLSSSTGAMTVTLTVPAGGGAAGTILVKQHGTTARDITWAVSAGTFSWLGTEPTWDADGVGKVRCVVWRYNGSILYLSSTDSN